MQRQINSLTSQPSTPTAAINRAAVWKCTYFETVCVFWRFKVIQGRWFWNESKARMRVSNFPREPWSYLPRPRFRDVASLLLCWKEHPIYSTRFWWVLFWLDCQYLGSEERRLQANYKNNYFQTNPTYTRPRHINVSDRQTDGRTDSKFWCSRGGVAVLNRKPAISLKQGKIIPMLLLMINRKSHSHFRLVPKSTTLHDLGWPWRP